MKIFKYSLAVTSALVLNSAVVQAELCSAPQYNPETAKVTVPCAITGGQQFSLELDFATPTNSSPDGLYWKWNNSGLSTCQWTPGSCATLDNDFSLTLPIEGVVEDTKYFVKLNYYPTNENGFFWEYDSHKIIDTENVITLKKGTPNPNGSFDSLYIFEGDFVHFEPEKIYDFRMDEGVTPPNAKHIDGDEQILRVFHINDFHSHLTDKSSKKGDTHRMSQMVKAIKEAKSNAKENETVIFVGAGDDHIGTVFDELLGYDANSFETSAAYTAYSAAGLDVAAIGNHELDRGGELLAKAIEANANFPILSASLYGSKFLNSNHYYPAVIGVANGLRIGVISLLTHEETHVKTVDEPELDVGDLVKTLQNTLPYVEPLSDVIILLNHVGYNGPFPGDIKQHELDLGEIADVQLAETAASMTDKPVILIGGHEHVVLNKDGLDSVIKTVPILHTGAFGKYLGEAEISLYNNGSIWRSQTMAHLIPIKNRDDRVTDDNPAYSDYEHDDDYDMEFEQDVMMPLFTKLESRMNEIIGVAGNSEDLTTESLISERYTGENAIFNFMNDAIVDRSVNFPEGPDGTSQAVDIAVFNATGSYNGITPGEDITFNDWYGIMAYADIVYLTEMTGSQIKNMLISNAKRIVRPEESEEFDLSGYISRGFLNFSGGLRYTIKLGKNKEETIATEITVLGEPIDNVLDKTFKIALTDYIANGNEGWKKENHDDEGEVDFDLTTLSFNNTGLIYRNEVIAYIRENGTVDESTGAVKDERIKVIP